MIKDIPVDSDFHRSAARFLESGWTEALEKIRYAREIKEWFEEAEEASGEADEAEEAKESLAVAHIAVYTGIEHLLRARIAAVSPFLLFAGPPGNWPKDCAKKDTPFADFKTVDAQDLVRIHDTVCQPKLSQQFQSLYEDLRRKRNSLIHTHTSQVSVVAKDMLVAILFATSLLVGPEAWLSWRRRTLVARDVHVEFLSWNFHLTWECDTAVSVLGAKETKEYLGIDKKRRRYYCPKCFANRSRQERKGGPPDFMGVAQLDPKDRTILRCAVCSETSMVERQRCPHDCKGDVIGGSESNDRHCLTCGLLVEGIS